jgi:predicted amidohydrolase
MSGTVALAPSASAQTPEPTPSTSTSTSTAPLNVSETGGVTTVVGSGVEGEATRAGRVRRVRAASGQE